MNKKSTIISALTGLIGGLVTSVPYEWSIGWSVFLWILLGFSLGRLSTEKEKVIDIGTAYGITFTLAFLYARVGIAHSGLIEYSLLVLTLMIIGGLVGAMVVFIGSEAIKRIQLREWLITLDEKRVEFLKYWHGRFG